MDPARPQVLEKIDEIRNTLRVAGYSEPRRHTADIQLDELAKLVCDLVSEPDGHIELMAAELKECEASPSLDAVLGAAREHCYSVTFRLSGDE